MKLVAALTALAAIQGSSPLTEIINSPLNDYNLSMDKAERSLVFARSELEFRKARIFTAERTANGWSRPTAIGFTDERYANSDPWLTPDGRTLYFISDRPA